MFKVTSLYKFFFVGVEKYASIIFNRFLTAYFQTHFKMI